MKLICPDRYPVTCPDKWVSICLDRSRATYLIVWTSELHKNFLPLLSELLQIVRDLNPSLLGHFIVFFVNEFLVHQKAKTEKNFLEVYGLFDS
jgi:hypothetical protein